LDNTLFKPSSNAIDKPLRQLVNVAQISYEIQSVFKDVAAFGGVITSKKQMIKRLILLVA